MKKVYSKPVVVVDTFLNNDATNALNFISTTIAPKSANLSNKFKRDNFSEKDLRKIADALNCDVEIIFKFRDSDSRI